MGFVGPHHLLIAHPEMAKPNLALADIGVAGKI